jgi:prolyl-tRNA synthetase
MIIYYKCREGLILKTKFVPEIKNPPAKTKDKGLIALVTGGAGVFNAKTGDIVFLPVGAEALGGIRETASRALMEEAGFQPIECGELESAAFSLAERFLRNYGDDALLWSLQRGTSVEICGWSADAAGATGAAGAAADALKAALSDKLPELFTISEAKDGCRASVVIAAKSAKGALNELPAFGCASCGAVFTADSKAERKPDRDEAEEEPLKDVHTPGTHTIQLLCDFLKIGKTDTLKAMLYTVIEPGGKKTLLFAMIRGDLNISMPKLAAWVEERFPGAEFRRAEEPEIVAEFGEVAGFCGPVGVPDNVVMIADLSLEGRKNLVVGGNRKDYHKTGCCWGRDFKPETADLLLVEKEIQCPCCGGELEEIFLRPLFTAEVKGAAGDNRVLSYRDRDGKHDYPFAVKGVFSAGAALLARLENEAS